VCPEASELECHPVEGYQRESGDFMNTKRMGWPERLTDMALESSRRLGGEK
jgi:hypothetical protein